MCGKNTGSASTEGLGHHQTSQDLRNTSILQLARERSLRSHAPQEAANFPGGAEQKQVTTGLFLKGIQTMCHEYNFISHLWKCSLDVIMFRYVNQFPVDNTHFNSIFYNLIYTSILVVTPFIYFFDPHPECPYSCSYQSNCIRMMLLIHDVTSV